MEFDKPAKVNKRMDDLMNEMTVLNISREEEQKRIKIARELED